MTSVPFPLKDGPAKKLTARPDIMDQPRSHVVNETVEQYLTHQDWMDLKTREAIADIDAGGILEAHEEVLARLGHSQKASRI